MNWNQSSANKINNQPQTQQGIPTQDYRDEQNLSHELLGALKQGYEDRFDNFIIFFFN